MDSGNIGDPIFHKLRYVEVHYGGYFDNSDPKKYVGGSFKTFEGIDLERVSMLDMLNLYQFVGAPKDSAIFYRSFEDGKVYELVMDSDVVEMATKYARFSLVKVFLVAPTELDVETENDVNMSMMVVNEDEVRDNNLAENEVSAVMGNVAENVNGNGPFFDFNDDSFLVEAYVAESNHNEAEEDDSDEVEEEDDDSDYDEAHQFEENTQLRIGDERINPHEHSDIESEYQPSEELISLAGSDVEVDNLQDDEVTSHFNMNMDLGVKAITVGMKFGFASDFRKALRMKAIVEKFDLEFKKNEGNRVTVICKDHCGWRIHASENSTDYSFEVKTFNDKHKCSGVKENSQVTQSFIAQQYVDRVMADPECSIPGLQSTVQMDLDIGVSKQKIYRAKRLALSIIEGSCEEQFRRSRDYCGLILESNPGSVANVGTKSYSDDGVSFFIMFFSLEAMWKGFLEGCRPFIGLDGCFLKGPYGGHLLCAVGRDANNKIFPIAIAQVESEGKDSWKWFLHSLFDIIGPYDKFTFISDRQKGLVELFEHTFPGADLRFCLKHLYENFKKGFKGKRLRSLYWEAAASFTRAEFEVAMQEMRQLDQKAHDYLMKIPTRVWARYEYSWRSKSSLCVNNMCESFNHFIGKAREKPIIYMFEKIRTQLMIRNQKNKEKMENHDGLVCPIIKEKLKEIWKDVRKLHVDYAGNGKYQVDNRSYHEAAVSDYVNVVDKTCSCLYWNVSGIPCKHAMAVALFRREDPEMYVHSYYHKSTFLKTYNYVVTPVSLRDMKREVGTAPILPPPHRNQPGRPPKNRTRAAEENPKKSRKATFRCTKCLQTWHNVRKCTAEAPTKKINKGKGGRPAFKRGTSGIGGGLDETTNQGRGGGSGVGKGTGKRGRPRKNASGTGDAIPGPSGVPSTSVPIDFTAARAAARAMGVDKCGVRPARASRVAAEIVNMIPPTQGTQD